VRAVRSPVLRSGAAALLLGLAACADGTGAGPSRPGRPSVVLVVADDLELAGTGRMPRLRSLVAGRGLTFTRAFASTPVCCPSRASMLTGQYAHNHGILSNLDAGGSCFERFRDRGQEASTLATWLRGAGYRTGRVGKYLNWYPGVRRGADPTYVPPGWDEWYGLFSSRGTDTYYNYFVNENRRIAAYGRREEDYATDVLRARAVEFVRRDDERPFFLWLSPQAPHLPATPAPRHEGALAGLLAPRTPSFNEEDMSDKPAWFQDPVRLPLLTARDVAGVDALYRDRLRTMLAVDEMVADVIAALEQTGRLDSTYVIFTSDNGFLLGQHRFPRGKGTVHEPSVRVPLLVRGPGVPAGARRDHLALNVDLAPTIAELAGAPAPGSFDGRSLAGLLGADPPAVERFRSEVLLELPHGLRDDPEEPPGWVGLRTPDLLYAEYATGEQELYDLRDDPDQVESLHGRASPALLRGLAARLDQIRLCRGPACP
jgi:arylsulfatase A-like enzyme